MTVQGNEIGPAIHGITDAVRRIADGDPTVRLEEIGPSEPIRSLQIQVNRAARGLGDLVELTHELAMGIAQHFEVLLAVAGGDLSARIRSESPIELLEALKRVTNSTIASVAHEIEERERAEAVIRRTQRIEALGTLSGGIAHDFNRLLSLIIGFNELAMDATEGSSPAARNLRSSLTAAIRARELVQQLLTFSRQAPREHRSVDVAKVFDETLDLLCTSLPGNVRLVRRVAATPCVVKGDETSLQQVLINLCTNAIHAMKSQGGVLTVELSPEERDRCPVGAQEVLPPGPVVRFTVQDTGAGIDARQLEHIFEPFYSTRERGEGTGLGLAVVHGTVQSHGGLIQVESEPGQGSSFHVYLPATETVVRVTSESEPEVLCGEESLLVVDDDPEILEVLELTLAGLGYRVETCRSARRALVALEETPTDFDMLITDLEMPHVRGDDLAAQVNRRLPDLPIVLLSGFGYQLSPDSTRALGIRRILQKPVLRKELVHAVRDVLDQAAQRTGAQSSRR